MFADQERGGKGTASEGGGVDGAVDTKKYPSKLSMTDEDKPDFFDLVCTKMFLLYVSESTVNYPLLIVYHPSELFITDKDEPDFFHLVDTKMFLLCSPK